MIEQLIFGLLGGLGMFLFGMKIMSEGLQKIAGNRIRSILEALTNNRIMGLFVGLFVTAIIQSSSATTVMVVGFVNAGLMTLIQSIGVILGANIGTTVTAQMIAFKVHHYALPLLGIGVFIKLFSKRKRHAYYGEVLLGFGLLFYGLVVMKGGFAPLKTHPEFINFFTVFGENPVLAVLVGAALTVVVQSSSATIGITMTLAASGLLSFTGAVALILGENIGTTITANLASIGTNTNAKRTARAHMLFNLFGALYMLLILPYFIQFIDYITANDPDFLNAAGEKPFIGRHIANAHSLFNLFNVIVFLPLTGVLAKLATWMVPQREGEEEYSLQYLDNKLLNTPIIAISEARKEVERMATVCCGMYGNAVEFLETRDMKLFEKVLRKEGVIDLLQKDITNFLVIISQQSITKAISKEIASLINIVSNLERVGDHCENLVLQGEKIMDAKIKISETAKKELDELSGETGKFLESMNSEIGVFNKKYLTKAKAFERRINKFEDKFRENHIQRLNDGECSVSAGLIYVDLLTNFEKIGDHTFNIAEAIGGYK
ncbi:Na/Pi cotransporter family protein [Thermodesulfobacteriota bacterium]